MKTKIDGSTVSKTYKVQTACGNFYVVICRHEATNELVSVMIPSNKNGGCPANIDAISLSINKMISCGISQDDIISMYSEIECGTCSTKRLKDKNFAILDIHSCASEIAKTIKRDSENAPKLL